ncbi:hypothetical protein [Paracoccus pantotrophus]|uniref:hypothetical protein n=1 Tax=Paracoccus pantotrophus TaxID=82367 RepID=UPI001618BCD8|nr:hypothetical protein [Paracoccus pantotrophus]
MSGDDEKPKGVDISQVGKVNAGNDDQSEPVRRIVDRTAQLSVGGRALQGALRGLGGVSALAEAARAASSVTMLKDQLDALTGVSVFTEQMKAQQKAMRALALPDVSAFSGITALADQFKIEQDAFAQARNLALGGLPGGFLNAITGSATGAASRFFQDMREQSSLINQHMDMFADMRRALKASSLFDLTKAVNIPRFGSAIEALGIGRMGSAIEAANAVHMLGLTPTFHDEFRSVAAALADQASAFARVRDLTSVAALNFDLAGSLEAMLARSLAAQEALLEEHKGAAVDAKAEAAFHRRVATIQVIISILTFFLTIALQLEARLSDGDAAVRANTEALVKMRNSFDAMAAQLEAMQETREPETERQDAADAEIASILRGIAKTLSDQAEAEPEAAMQAPETPSPNRGDSVQ